MNNLSDLIYNLTDRLEYAPSDRSLADMSDDELHELAERMSQTTGYACGRRLNRILIHT